MKFMLDTIDLEDIKEMMSYFPISGITSNPSIIKSVAPNNFYNHMRKIRQIIGNNCSLHIQIISSDYENMLKEAKYITSEIDKEVYIKIPVTKDGLRAIKELKVRGYNVTATAVYTKLQAYLALECGADYIAPYVNRILNLESNPYDLINSLRNLIMQGNYKCQIVAASFKSLNQIYNSLDNGAHSVTVTPELLKQIFDNPSIDLAVNNFKKDWEMLYGETNTCFK
ncbi:MAG: fructose-6-phosphate aldolase [Bacilli bacterium]